MPSKSSIPLPSESKEDKPPKKLSAHYCRIEELEAEAAY